MPVPKIVAVATATPPNRFTQVELLALAGYRDEDRQGFFRRSDIEGRRLTIHEYRILGRMLAVLS